MLQHAVTCCNILQAHWGETKDDEVGCEIRIMIFESCEILQYTAIHCKCTGVGERMMKSDVGKGR